MPQVQSTEWAACAAASMALGAPALPVCEQQVLFPALLCGHMLWGWDCLTPTHGRDEHENC